MILPDYLSMSSQELQALADEAAFIENGKDTWHTMHLSVLEERKLAVINAAFRVACEREKFIVEQEAYLLDYFKTEVS